MPWEGSCNRCGLCCTQVVDGVPTRCENLRIVSSEEAVCGKYEQRWEGMPVRLIDVRGVVRKIDQCLPAWPVIPVRLLHVVGARHEVPAKCGYHWVPDEESDPKP